MKKTNRNQTIIPAVTDGDNFNHQVSTTYLYEREVRYSMAYLFFMTSGLLPGSLIFIIVRLNHPNQRSAHW